VRSFEPHLLAVRHANVETTYQVMSGVTQLYYHSGGGRHAPDGRAVGHDDELAAAYRREWLALSVLLRDIFGNPYRSTTFSPFWRTDTALSLARQMYESRDFGAMPILADALQDAGCESDDILDHCRDANATHVRGCWVVDLVLNRS
jgi:hypothetical protein